ncbi:circadian clock KaiB family protein [Hydrogenophaga sp.]|uniref:circadian clock KaiB family protein n=1 Tax=Hydrogenophaga sp. TaxID=1904254 RepID=UPI002718DC04|nr:circadian clock KaiB family protein [Hydrogenophaga sp.]MDO9436606.1 circadian clock KaiB family protein [Hydrogenophaga sp.]
MDPVSAIDSAAEVGPLAQTFRLYVSAVSPRSSRAVVNARKFFEEHFAGSHVLEVLDIADNIDAARADQVIASPTLIRVAPLPQRRFVGDMSNTESLRLALGIKRSAPGA